MQGAFGRKSQAAKMQTMMQFETEDHQEFRIIDRDGEPWFVLADVCKALDIKNPSDAAARLDPEEKMTLDLAEGQSGVRGGARRMNIINESGLYSTILRSEKAGAKRFKKWITSEVLPSIRRTGGYKLRPDVPAFIRRYNENWDRVEAGHFSVLNELVVHLWGRLEHAGRIMADKSPDGTENRPDVSVGRCFSDWLKKRHPGVSASFSYYLHKTSEWEGEVRQYPFATLPLFREYLDAVWIPQRAADYLRTRDPDALPFLQKLLPSQTKPKVGMTRRVT
jgi:prophage antirepressor-like protein